MYQRRLSAILAALLIAFTAGSAFAEVGFQEFLASTAVDADGSAKCLARRTGWVFQSLGPCDETELPRRFSIGDSIRVDGRDFAVGIIRVTRFLDDYEGFGVSVKKGEIRCLILQSDGEYKKFLSETEETEWILIGNCRPGRRL